MTENNSSTCASFKSDFRECSRQTKTLKTWTYYVNPKKFQISLSKQEDRLKTTTKHKVM